MVVPFLLFVAVATSVMACGPDDALRPAPATQPGSTLTDLPAEGSFIVVAGDFGSAVPRGLLLYNTGKHSLHVWNVSPTNDIESVLAHRPILLRDRIIGDDGRYTTLAPPDGELLAVSLASRQIAFKIKTQTAVELRVARLDGSDVRVLAETVDVSRAVWSADGRTLTFADGSHIWRVHDDGGGLTSILALPGLPVTIQDGAPDEGSLAIQTQDWLYHLDLADGTLTRLQGASERNDRLSFSMARWSRDSETLAITNSAGNRHSELLLWPKNGQRLRHIFDAGVLAVTWSPDSDRLAVWGVGDCTRRFDLEWGLLNDCAADLYVIDADGGDLTRLTALEISEDVKLKGIYWFRR
jgi:WD40 repeat protein